MVTKRSKKREEKLVKAAVETGGSQTRDVINAFMKHKVSVVALVVLVLILIAAIVSGFIFSEEQITSITAEARLQPPSLEHWFGTDSFGRDVFARTIYGARYSLFFGLTTAACALVIARRSDLRARISAARSTSWSCASWTRSYASRRFCSCSPSWRSSDAACTASSSRSW